MGAGRQQIATGVRIQEPGVRSKKAEDKNQKTQERRENPG